MPKKHRTNKQRTKKRTTKKGAIKWGNTLNAEEDYRILADEITRINNNDINRLEKLYLRFRKEWLNIIKEGYEDKFYGRLTGIKISLWKSMDIFYMNKPKSRQFSRQRSFSRMRKKMLPLLKKQGSRKSRSRSRSDKTKSGKSKSGKSKSGKTKSGKAKSEKNWFNDENVLKKLFTR